MPSLLRDPQYALLLYYLRTVDLKNSRAGSDIMLQQSLSRGLKGVLIFPASLMPPEFGVPGIAVSFKIASCGL